MWRDCPKRALYGISLVFNFGIPNPANLPFLACLSYCLRWMEVGGSSYSALPHLIYSVRCWLEIQLDQPKGWGMVRLLELPHSLFHSRTSWRDFQDYSTCICEVGSLKRSCTIWGYCKAPHINSCPQTTTFFFFFFSSLESQRQRRATCFSSVPAEVSPSPLHFLLSLHGLWVNSMS